MVQIDKEAVLLDEKCESALRLFKPGKWYCFTEFAGCTTIPQEELSTANRLMETLAKRGFIESVPVFEGFVTLKHRITRAGKAWLAAR